MKKVKYVLLIILILLFTVNAQEKVFVVDDELKIKELDKNIYLVVHSFPWAANSLVVKFDNNELLFIDTPYTPEASEKVMNYFIAADSNNYKVTVINTHFHVDNLGGNEYFQKLGADIYGSTLTVELLNERGLGNGMLDMLNQSGNEKYYNYFKAMKLFPPNKLFDINKELILVINNENMEIFYPGPGHSEDNVVVYFPNRDILFGGCLIKSLQSRTKGNIGDADLVNWAASVGKVKEKFGEAKIIIPGHGEPGGIDLFDHTIKIVSEK